MRTERRKREARYLGKSIERYTRVAAIDMTISAGVWNICIHEGRAKSAHGKVDLLVGNVQDQKALGFPNGTELVTRLAMKVYLTI